MTVYAVYQTVGGALVSVGTVVANPLPVGLTAVALSIPDAQGLRDGTKTWDPATLTCIARPVEVADATRATLDTQAGNAITADRAYIALAAPTNLEVRDQVDALTKQVIGLIRLLVKPETLTDGTVD